jgi:hypothetical protein
VSLTMKLNTKYVLSTNKQKSITQHLPGTMDRYRALRLIRQYTITALEVATHNHALWSPI